MVKVFVHQIARDGREDLSLITNVEADARSPGALYQRRYCVEFDIHDLKVSSFQLTAASRRPAYFPPPTPPNH